MFLALETCEALKWIFYHLIRLLLGESRKLLWKNMQLQLRCGSWAHVTCVKSPGTVCCRAASHIRCGVWGHCPPVLSTYVQWMPAVCLALSRARGQWWTGWAEALSHWNSCSRGESWGGDFWIFMPALSRFSDLCSCHLLREAFPDYPFYNSHTLAIILYPFNLLFFITLIITDLVIFSYVFLYLSF